MRTNVQAGETPAQITVSMIDADLKNGIGKSEMAIKYGIKPWEVDEMFKHPFLAGRRPSRKQVLSFTFVDDTLPNAEPMADSGDENDANPNQVTLEQAIEECEAIMADAKTSIFNGMATQQAVVDMFSPSNAMATQQAIIDILSPSEEEEGEDVITESKPEWIEDKIATQQAISEEEVQESDYDNEDDDIETLEDDGAYSNDDDDDALEDIIEMDENSTFQL